MAELLVNVESIDSYVYLRRTHSAQERWAARNKPEVGGLKAWPWRECEPVSRQSHPADQCWPGGGSAGLTAAHEVLAGVGGWTACMRRFCSTDIFQGRK